MKDNSLLEAAKILIDKLWDTEAWCDEASNLHQINESIASHSSTSYNQWPTDLEIDMEADKLSNPRDRMRFRAGASWLKQKLSESAQHLKEYPVNLPDKKADIMSILFMHSRTEHRNVGNGCNHTRYILYEDAGVIVRAILALSESTQQESGGEDDSTLSRDGVPTKND